MELEEEKKLVAEKLMGWKIINHNNSGHRFWRYYAGGDEIHPDNWNPQLDRNCWPEIWVALRKDVRHRPLFLYRLAKHLKINGHNFRDDMSLKHDWALLTADPEICWKALVEVLNG